jgi:hypothetical protein
VDHENRRLARSKEVAALLPSGRDRGCPIATAKHRAQLVRLLTIGVPRFLL